MNNNTVAKVIAVCFVPRDVRLQSHGTTHAQNLSGPDAVLQMVIKTVEKEREIDPGLPMDTIIVNNDEGFLRGRVFLNTIHGTPTKTGTFRVLHRENYGRSFGAYDYAFKKYKDEYDHWIFSEDDMYFSKNGYAKEYLNVLNNSEDCGFVAAIGVGRSTDDSSYDGPKDHQEWLNINTELHSPTPHAHGGCGLTHKKYLEETIPITYNCRGKKYNPICNYAVSNCLKWLNDNDIDPSYDLEAFKIGGCLAHYTGKSPEENRNQKIHCVVGEVPFTYSIVRLGHKIATPKNPETWYKSHF